MKEGKINYMPSTQRKRKTISILVPFLFIAAVFGFMIFEKYQASSVVNPKPAIEHDSGKRTAVLFFIVNGNQLAREARELEPCTDDSDCVKEVLDELFNGPVSELDDALPEGSLLNGVKIKGDLAVVDVNHNFERELTAGGSVEKLAIYSIVNTICINFPHVSRVSLTVEGEVKPLLGHLDVSQPLRPDYTLEQRLPVSPSSENKTSERVKGKQ